MVSVPLPTGTVTFMFTDIEGSTQLAQMFGADYSPLIEDHFGLIRAALDRNDGIEVKTTGDGCFAAFASAKAAVRAAGEIQTTISGFAWPEHADVRVRIGLHTGEATVSDDDYVGVEVHRAARIMSAAHGGQVLASEATRQLVGDELEFVSLGRHRLRGLDNDEALYQIQVPGLPSGFPPIRTASSTPNNLPVRTSSIVGRDTDIDFVSELISENRLVTILGPGGVGKTSLAVTIGNRVLGQFSGGVTFVDLSSVADPAFVITSVADEMGLETKTVEGIATHIGSGSILLILDNLEQLLDAAPDIGKLLSQSNEIRVLATSQAPLRLPGEQRYLLKPFGTQAAADSAGVQLFIERAHAADPSLKLEPDEVAEIVAMLDGLPLAIELTAAMASVLSLSDMVERLRSGRPTFHSASGAPRRHASLDSALEWSYGLLDDRSRTVFRRLSVFVGGMSLSSAEHVAGGEAIDALPVIVELVDRSLLLRQSSSSGRFHMLDGIRRYGMRMLAESGEADEATARFVEHFCQMGAEAHAGLQSDRGQWWQARIDEELGNFREVLSLLHASGDTERGFELLGNIWRFHHSRGHLVELGVWLDRFFGLPGAGDESRGLAKGLMARAAASYWRGDADAAIADYEEAVRIARALEDRPVTADALFGLATSILLTAKPEKAVAPIKEAGDIYQDLGDVGGYADIVTAEAFVRLRTQGLVGLSPAIGHSVDLYLRAGREVQATQSIFVGAAVAIAEERLDDARTFAVRGIERAIELNDVFLQTWGLQCVAGIEIQQENVELGALYAGAAQRSRERIGGGWGMQALGLPSTADILSERFGQERAEQLMAPGRDLTLTDAIAMALDSE